MDEIYVSDSYGAVFSWTKPDPSNPNIDIDANPSSATFKSVRARTGETVSSGNATVTGNDTTATVAANVLNRVGNYALYVTAVFSDGTTLTRSRPFRVKAKDGS